MNEYAIRILVTQMYIDAELVNGESRVRQLQSAIDILRGEVIAEGKLSAETDLTTKNNIWDYAIISNGEVISLFDLLKNYNGQKISISKIKE
jgi:hypothetical protein